MFPADLLLLQTDRVSLFFYQFISNRIRIILRYPNISKAVSTFFGLIEVAILEGIRIIDAYFYSGFSEKAMKSFNQIYGSRVIPLNINLDNIPTISSTEELIGIIRRIPSLAIGYCYCRSKKQACNHDLWTCIHIGSAKSLDELKDKIPLKSATIQEVENLLIESDQKGLVHQLITTPSSNYFYVICNCCPCCCVMLQTAVRRKRPNVAITSNFVSVTTINECLNCGNCVNRCYFGARILEYGKLVFRESECRGCGLCVSICEFNAISMTRRNPEDFSPIDSTNS